MFSSPSLQNGGSERGSWSVRGTQVGEAAVKSVLRHTPPPAVPKNMAGVSAPSTSAEMAMAHTRPELPADTSNPVPSSGAGPTPTHDKSTLPMEPSPCRAEDLK